MRRGALFVTLMLCTSACGGLARHGAVPASHKPVHYGGKGFTADPVPSFPKVNKRLLGKAQIKVTVTDDGNKPVPGALVTFKGPVKVSRVTDARGVTVATVKAGTYKVFVPPCGDTIVTTTYAEGEVVAPEGRIVNAPLTGVTWKRRFAPTASIDQSKAPPWKRGQLVTLGVAIEDQCTHKVAPKVRLAHLGWRFSNFGVRGGLPSAADKFGYARITVGCNAKGRGSVIVYDRGGKAESVDLIAAGTQPPAGISVCE